MATSPIPYPRRDLFAQGPQPTYTGRQLDEIAFPLGGIGSGMITLGGWGQLRDWEIRNRPAKGCAVPEDAFFTLQTRVGRGTPVTKVLQGPVQGGYTCDGHSLKRQLGEGLPHFRKVSFQGAYPFAQVQLSDPDVPVQVTLHAFNPFIPLNDKDSSIPVAILCYRLKNTAKQTVRVRVMGNLTNIIGETGQPGRVNRARKGKGLGGLVLSHEKLDPGSPAMGSMALVAIDPKAKVWTQWTDARTSKFWEAITTSDRFPKPGTADTGTVAVSYTLKPGESVTSTWLVTWYFPNFQHWAGCGGPDCGAVWKNYYATVWDDAWDVASYVAGDLPRLYDQTRLFADTLFDSTLPMHVLDAVSSQMSILKTPTCLRLTDGTFYGFEGCSNTSGCCEGSCTHVWNYAQALPYLFPALQRSMREADYTHNIRNDGFGQFRMALPLGTQANWGFLPAADGQMGSVIQVYREWQISGDDAWLRKMWPKTKKALEFAWKYWDADRDGLMEGMQHNTYDIEFHGANTMMGSLYLGALRACEEMARALGETEKADEYRAVFEKGSALSDRRLFNGEYYEQKVNPDAYKMWPTRYQEPYKRHGLDDRYKRWPKWQYGTGCISDQLIGQWYGEMLGLGHFYKPAHVRKALRSVFKYNWRADLSDHACLLRVYAVNDEAGLLIGTWPRGGRPGYGFYFSDEVWCGIEYQVASHMIYEGMVEEGLAIVMGVRQRHRGDRRNPWDEFECGHHYSRSMASYAVLTALSGFSYSAPERRIGFAPRVCDDDFRCFFSVGSGWGQYRQRHQRGRADLALDVRYGSLTVGELHTAIAAPKSGKVRVRVGACNVPAAVRSRRQGAVVVLDSPVTIQAGDVLRVTLG